MSMIKDVIDYCTKNEQNGILLFVDFKKAFNALEFFFYTNLLIENGFWCTI